MSDVWSGHILLPDGSLITGMEVFRFIAAAADKMQKSASRRKMSRLYQRSPRPPYGSSLLSIPREYRYTSLPDPV
jgi:hypothetical protein